MPLSLKDPRWSELQGSYGDTKDIVAWLTEAQQSGGLSSERLGDLINEVQHQGDTSTAMYAVAIYLIEFARRATPGDALNLLTHAGLIHANSTKTGAVSCPAFLREEFVASAAEGATMLAPLLPLATNFDAYKWSVAGLAGFRGQHEFALFLDGFGFLRGPISPPAAWRPVSNGGLKGYDPVSNIIGANANYAGQFSFVSKIERRTWVCSWSFSDKAL